MCALRSVPTETLFRALVDQAGDAFFLNSLDGRILDVNQQACESLGYSRAELLTMTLGEINSEVEHGSHQERVWDDLVPGRFVTVEGRHRRKDGTTFPVEVRVGLLEIEDETVMLGLARDITKRKGAQARHERLNRLEASLLEPGSLDDKVRRVTDGVVDLLGADFARIWLTRPGDRCDSGCRHAKETEGPHVCRRRDRCLHLVASSGRYTHLDGDVHGRVPFGCYKIGRVAAAKEPGFLTNEVTRDPRVHDRAWAEGLGLVSFAGYKLQAADGTPVGVLAMFARHEIDPGGRALLETIATIASHVVRTAVTEEVATERESHFQSLLSHMREDIIVIDRDRRVTDVNASCLVTVGGTRDEVIGRTCHDLLHGREKPCDKVGCTCHLDEVFETGEFRSYHRVERRDGGTTVHVDVMLSPVRDEAGKVTHVIEAVRDVSELIRYQERLGESERRYRTLVETAPAVIVGLSPEGLITEWNPEAESVFGMRREEVLGRNYADLFLPMEDRGRVEDDIRAVLAGESTRGLENRIRAGGGDERVLTWNVERLLDEDGAPIGIISVGHDITERKHAERAERHAAAVTEAIAEASLGYLESGSIGAIARMIVEHAARITESQFGVLIDLDETGTARILAVSSMAWTGETGPGVYAEAREAIRSRGGCPLESKDSLILAPIREGTTIVSNDPGAHPRWSGSLPEGHPPVESFLGVPMRIGDEVVGMLAIANRPDGYAAQEVREAEAFANTAVLALRLARSEEERERIEQQLRQSQKMEAVGQLAGGIAHDFNNLLVGILGHTEFAMHGLDEGDPRRVNLEQVMASGDKAATLVRQLLAFGRRQVMALRDLDLNTVIRDLARMLARVIGENVALEIVPGHRLGTVQADPGHVEQMVMNLVVNARDAMPDGGQVTVETENVVLDEAYCRRHPSAKPGRYVLLSVTDTGIGMSEEIQSRAFEPFFTTKPTGRGTGLGLSTVYGIVKQHHGTVNLYSEPGVGTTFKVYLPIVARRAVDVEKKVVGRTVGGTETILLAEDDELVRCLATEMLERAGYRVHVADDGEEALKLFEAHADEIDLVLLDVIMPKMGGRVVMERVRESRPGVRFLFASGYSANASHTEFVQDAGVRLLMKPYDSNDLLRAVREVIDGGESSRPR